jgi:hypothetical protein
VAGRIVRGSAALVLGALWWCSVLRLALAPDAGVLEGAVAASGWGLSLLPVHCVPKSRAVGAVGSDRWWDHWRKVWRRRGSGGGGGGGRASRVG